MLMWISVLTVLQVKAECITVKVTNAHGMLNSIHFISQEIQAL